MESSLAEKNFNASLDLSREASKPVAKHRMLSKSTAARNGKRAEGVAGGLMACSRVYRHIGWT